MADFRFLHAADIHLDSPLHGLSRYEGVPVEAVRGATRAAFDNLIQLALSEMVEFVVIAGGLFDGDWRDMSTGLYFAAAMGRLAESGMPAFVLSGNHDAASVLTKSLPWPETVRVFGHRRPESHRLQELGVALHGQSFANVAVTDNLAQAYPAPDPNLFNTGVLHTALAGHPGHAPYAPCTLAELEAKGYDYWALGHVHDFAVLCEAPHVVFPGNLQGRNIRETGPKGAVLVEVRDRAVTSLTPMPLDVVRWARVEVDCSDAGRRAGEERAAAFLADKTALRTAEEDIAALRRRLEGARANQAEINADWDRERSAAGLELRIETAEGRLAVLEELRELRDTTRDLERRIEGIRRDARDFAAEVDALADGLDVGPGEPARRLEALQAGLTTARATAEALRELRASAAARRGRWNRPPPGATPRSPAWPRRSP